MQNLTKYLNVMQAAKFMGVCRGTIYYWNYIGKLDFKKHPITSRNLILRSDLTIILSSLETNLTEQPAIKYFKKRRMIRLVKENNNEITG